MGICMICMHNLVEGFCDHADIYMLIHPISTWVNLVINVYS